MRRRYYLISGVLILVFAAVGIRYYQANLAPAATAKRAGATFLEAVANRDLEAVRRLLAADAAITGAQVLEQFKDVDSPKAIDVVQSLTNQSGVEYLVLAFGRKPTGDPTGTTLALKRENGRWVIVQAGANFSYQ